MLLDAQKTAQNLRGRQAAPPRPAHACTARTSRRTPARKGYSEPHGILPPSPTPRKAARSALPCANSPGRGASWRRTERPTLCTICFPPSEPPPMASRTKPVVSDPSRRRRARRPLRRRGMAGFIPRQPDAAQEQIITVQRPSWPHPPVSASSTRRPPPNSANPAPPPRRETYCALIACRLTPSRRSSPEQESHNAS